MHIEGACRIVDAHARHQKLESFASQVCQVCSAFEILSRTLKDTNNRAMYGSQGKYSHKAKLAESDAWRHACLATRASLYSRGGAASIPTALHAPPHRHISAHHPRHPSPRPPTLRRGARAAAPQHALAAASPRVGLREPVAAGRGGAQVQVAAHRWSQTHRSWTAAQRGAEAVCRREAGFVIFCLSRTPNSPTCHTPRLPISHRPPPFF